MTAAVHRAVIDPPTARERLTADEDVLGDRQVGEQSRLLIDHRDPTMRRFGRAAQEHRLACDHQVSAVGLVDAAEDLDQRRLAGTVLTDQGVRLTREQVKRYVASA